MSDSGAVPEGDHATPRLSAERAAAIAAPVSLDDLTWQRAIELLNRQDGIGHFLPDGVYGVDPRNGEATLFNQSRARRPHDNTPGSAGSGANTTGSDFEPCSICAGDTTEIIDTAELSDGFTFINENLYPIVHPESQAPPDDWVAEEYGGHSLGLHFIQWTSSRHDVDWPALDPGDRARVLDRLAALEYRLLTLPGYPAGERHVSIIKNVGRLVGGSLNHPHQQIVLSSAVPRRVGENRAFAERTGRTFTEFLRRENPSELTIARLQTGRFLVPYFMRRPYNLLYALDDLRPSRLSETSAAQRRDLGLAMAMGMRMTQVGLDLLDREEAYNVVFHLGPGTGMYLEFLPRSQEDGGFEQLGLSACQSSPFLVARALREVV